MWKMDGTHEPNSCLSIEEVVTRENTAKNTKGERQAKILIRLIRQLESVTCFLDFVVYCNVRGFSEVTWRRESLPLTP